MLDQSQIKDGLGDDDYLEIPSSIESLSNSAEQMQQLAGQIVEYYQKLFLCYSYAAEPKFGPLDHCLEACLKSSSFKRSIGEDQQVDSFADTISSYKNSPRRIGLSPKGAKDNLNLDTLVKDHSALLTLESIFNILPLLNEINSLVERCFATIEATFKRITYHLTTSFLYKANSTGNSGPKTQTTTESQFRLTRSIQIDSEFIALMDLIYALVCLEQTLKNHTNLSADLSALITTCQAIIDSRIDETTNIDSDAEQSSIDKLRSKIDSIPSDKLRELIDMLGTIKLTLSLDNDSHSHQLDGGDNSSSMFECLLEQFQHLDIILSKEKTRIGFNELSKLYGDFLVFYCENLISATGERHQIESQSVRVLINHNLGPSLYLRSSISKRLFGISCLFYLYSAIFKKTADIKKLSKLFNQTLKRYAPANNVVVLDGCNCHIVLSAFLRHQNRRTPDIQIDSKFLDQLGHELESQTKSDPKMFATFSMDTMSWLIRLKAKIMDQASIHAASEIVEILEQGLTLAHRIQNDIRTELALHHHFSRPITKDGLVLIFRKAILLKSIQEHISSVRYNSESLDFNHGTRRNLVEIEHLLRLQWRKMFVALRKNQLRLKYSDRKLSLPHLISLSSICLKPEMLLSSQGRILISICLSMLVPVIEHSQNQQRQHSLIGLNRLLSLASVLTLIDRYQRATDCSFLYWNQETFGTFYNAAFDEFPGAFNELKYFHLALDDTAEVLIPSWPKPPWSRVNLDWLLEERDKLLRNFGDELLAQFKSDYLDRVSQELENELRLQTHRELCAEDHSNPFRRHMYNFKQMFANKLAGSSTTFRLLNQTINFERYIEHHLNKVCYNLTALAPHDWFTYDSMLNLARHRHKLKFVNGQLPAQNIDYGLDLLDIIRNLSIFTSRYSYDLTNQLFIEKCTSSRPTSSIISGAAGSMISSFAPSNQWLNVIQIQHVTKSLQAHGFGTLDSAVNCTYQTLKRLINLFSRQLMDDKLRACLQKEQLELQLAMSNAAQPRGRNLSYDRANRMAKRFRLRASSLNNQQQAGRQSNSVDLDTIRQTVTQLGNLLAFVRLLKSGALNCASRSVDYVPDLSELSNLRLSERVKSEFSSVDSKLVASLLEASENFDQCLSDLESNFSPKTNYFNIIVQLFKNLLADDQPVQNSVESSVTDKLAEESKRVNKSKAHLKLFFLLVPALTINYVDYLINCKERLTSRSPQVRFGSLISDDGFSMGVAFLLTILGQTKHFLNLVWLQETCLKLGREICEVEERLNDAKLEESLRQTSSMTLRRLKRLHAEYSALDRTLNCALLLFRSCVN